VVGESLAYRSRVRVETGRVALVVQEFDGLGEDLRGADDVRVGDEVAVGPRLARTAAACRAFPSGGA
jgi:hypothetical protein